MTSTDDRLDHLIGLVELLFANQLNDARTELRSDPIVAGLLGSSGDWIPAGELATRVASATGSSERTVQRRMSDLIAQRLLMAEGATASRRIKSTGLA